MDARLVEQAVVVGGEQAASDWGSVIDALGLGPALAYVGFSMGAMHGTITPAAISTLRAAVFGIAGVPLFALERVRATGSDTPHLLAARVLRECEVFMMNTVSDELFPPQAVLALFEAFPEGKRRLMLWDGDHVTEPQEMIDEIVLFSSDTPADSASTPWNAMALTCQSLGLASVVYRDDLLDGGEAPPDTHGGTRRRRTSHARTARWFVKWAPVSSWRQPRPRPRARRGPREWGAAPARSGYTRA